MAIRYSGDLKITVTYDDRNFYRSSISKDGKVVWRGRINPPPAGFGSGIGYDSEKVYDKVAQAALSFADNDKPGLVDYAEIGGEETFKIRRVKGYWEKWPGGRIKPKKFSRDNSQRRKKMNN